MDDSRRVNYMSQAPHQSRTRRPARSSPLHKSSAGDLSHTRDDVGTSPTNEAKNEQTSPRSQPPQKGQAQKRCILSVHEPGLCKDDIVINPSLFGDYGILPGHLMQVRALKDGFDHSDAFFADSVEDARLQHAKSPNAHAQEAAPTFHDEQLDMSKQHVFLLRPVTQDMLAKQPNLHISMSQRISVASGFEKRNQVLVSAVNDSSCNASHVEIIFRDQYLARADMWRLIAKELNSTCIYAGQTILFLECIKATVKTIFIRGKKVPSAFFSSSTKPIFRSESARYVLFIQMSKEMWDFDIEGTGEIMFDKVINGFLPDLFKRWQQMKVKHLVSIVLFTRMVYEERLPADSNNTHKNPKFPDNKEAPDGSTKDFYRVVVSDIASGEWNDILNQLKKEFKLFRRNISIRRPDPGDHLPLGASLSSALADLPDHVIAGRPSAATRGNLLEAISLASSQFSTDYIDRDLVRTGVSVVVVSPSAGLFEVDYNLLVATTENLIDNGVGIDLVCLSRMPLHSVPLFKYCRPRHEVKATILQSRRSAASYDNPPTGSLPVDKERRAVPTVRLLGESPPYKNTTLRESSERRWSFGVPHWVDISFWTSQDGEKKPIPDPKKIGVKPGAEAPRHKQYNPRVKMYELQMMGVTENALSDISIPYLSRTFHLPPQTDPRNLSESLKRTGALPVSSPFSLHGTNSDDQKSTLSTSFNSTVSSNPNGTGPLFQWMDEYDDRIFCHPRAIQPQRRKAKSTEDSSRNGPYRNQSASLLDSSASADQDSSLGNIDGPSGKSFLVKAMQGRTSTKKLDGKGENVSSTLNATQGNQLKPRLTKRQISLGPRGFGVAAPKAAASTRLSVESPERPLIVKSGLRSQLSVQQVGTSPSPMKIQRSDQASITPNVQDASTGVEDVMLSSDSESPQISRPIAIGKAAAARINGQIDARTKTTPRASRENIEGELYDRLAALQDLREEDQATLITDPGDVKEAQPPQAMSPSTTLAPWLTILNPSNPSKTSTVLASRLGRWQHIFPRPLRTSQIKWKSLCSPAAIPLTTEDFPTPQQLKEEYQESSYQIEVPGDVELSENPRSLLTEIITFRLSRGFQIVVGSRLAESIKAPALREFDVFDQGMLAHVGATMVLAKGSTFHQVTRLDEGRVNIKQLIRHNIPTPQNTESESMLYKPSICSMLAESYDTQAIQITPQHSNFDWKMIDSFLIGNERPKAESFVENLRPWRTRFVLIPNDQPSHTRRSKQPVNEDNEEEIRLEGIRKLTQMWQRFRYVPPDERRFQAPAYNRKDTNPLDILYQTRDPSAIIAAELENVAEGESNGRPVQLLPESDLYQRTKLNIASLAETIQSDKGVRMLDRRWHLRLHYNCFIGFEFTTWLLQNFRDVDTREEAEELGNELMKSGMFQHVEQRHNFRDGNYFYQIAGEYRAPRPESKRWFGRGKSSVPSTPISDSTPQELPKTGRSRASSYTDTDIQTPAKHQQRLSIALSKSLLYDVDHRKRSYRPEVINLHYDRLHNPDNCYHIRIEWMNTTSKLIQDTVVSWATLIAKYGLRLVEVPLGEASSISSMHPFRAPCLIKFAQKPPAKQPRSYFDTTSFTPQPVTDKHPFQKAIMKLFNFVLDFEAASDFPADVDVSYSWGKPDYHYSQYIHRSGVVIAQITDEGDFLLLANRMYNNRNATSAYQDVSRMEGEHGPGIYRTSPHRSAGNINSSSPFASPLEGAKLDVPPPSLGTKRGSSLASTAYNLATTSQYGPSIIPETAESLKKDFEAFCYDKQALETFYASVLSTPLGYEAAIRGEDVETPSKPPNLSVAEGSIPKLTLPINPVSKGEKKQSEGEITSIPQKV